MNKILVALHLDQPDSLKRVLVTLFGGLATLAVPFINAHLTTPLVPEQVTSAMTALAAITATFLLQSGANSAVGKLADAKLAAAVATEPSAITPTQARAYATPATDAAVAQSQADAADPTAGAPEAKP